MAIKVLVIDDSAMIRKVFEQELSKDPGIQVVGTAPDPFVGRDMIVKLKHILKICFFKKLICKRFQQ